MENQELENQASENQELDNQISENHASAIEASENKASEDLVSPEIDTQESNNQEESEVQEIENLETDNQTTEIAKDQVADIQESKIQESEIQTSKASKDQMPVSDKQQFINELNVLVANEDVLSVSREVNELKTKFADFILEEDRKKQVAQLEAQERGETVNFEQEADPLREEFFAIYNSFKEKRKDASDAKKAVQAQNYTLKKNLLDELKTLVAEEENIGSLFGKRKEIHEKWKVIGAVPKEKHDELQNEYSKITEDFFYNVKIYKELKDFDLKKNYQLKMEVIDQVGNLILNQNMKEVDQSFRHLQNEWDEAGPVGQDQWEELKDKYWNNVKLVREKINKFYDEKRGELQENLNKKFALIKTSEDLLATLTTVDNAKDWETKTIELLQIQNDWKQIGFGPKKENEVAWKEFRANCNMFFEKKKEFYDVIKSDQNVLADKKLKLIEQALALKENTNWKETSEKLIQLQKQWKTIGHAGQRNEQKLWKDFRGACDSFFNSKQKHFESLDKANEVNLIAKQDLISKIETYSQSDDKQKTLSDLREFSATFNAIGHVPMAEKDNVYNAYKKAVDNHYDKLKLEGAEKDQAMFQAKMDSLKANPNSEKAFEKEKIELRKQIDFLNQEVILFGNNLGYFAKSKGADILRKEVENKIEISKNKIVDLKKKLKMLSSEQVN